MFKLSDDKRSTDILRTLTRSMEPDHPISLLKLHDRIKDTMKNPFTTEEMGLALAQGQLTGVIQIGQGRVPLYTWDGTTV